MKPTRPNRFAVFNGYLDWFVAGRYPIKRRAASAKRRTRLSRDYLIEIILAVEFDNLCVSALRFFGNLPTVRARPS